MKNIQVIDGANNCTYDIFACSDDDFEELFPGQQQDIEFADDAAERLGEERLSEVFDRLWTAPVQKKLVIGIHGTLFFGLEEKKRYYPSKRSDEMVIALYSGEDEDEDEDEDKET